MAPRHLAAWRDRGAPLARLGVLVAALAGGGADAAFGARATSEDALVTEVKAALLGHDLAAFDDLVNWDRATKMRRRMVTYQLRYGFGRPIRSVTLEPFPADGFDELRERGTLEPNMPVTRQIRVVFDEPANDDGQPPSELFLIGRQGDAYKIALVVPTKKPGDAK